MICGFCNSDKWQPVFKYDKPDRYEEWVGINKVERSWEKCVNCGFYQQRRNYPLSDLEVIYKDGYRHPDFRGEEINETFDRVWNLPPNESENHQRCHWIVSQIGMPESLLDIGSGFGVFPYQFRMWGVAVLCTEENDRSLDFMRSLGLLCLRKPPKRYDFELVSAVHVLEHIENPLSFLRDIGQYSSKHLYIEVPDAIEFGHKDKHSDEFNSCHVHFYSMKHLKGIIEKAGFKRIAHEHAYYPERDLSRLMILGEKK